MAELKLSNWPRAQSPFHEGEQIVQARMGVRDKIEGVGRAIIRGAMPEQHRVFFTQLPFLVMGACDLQGQPWATLLSGQPGFVSSPDPESLRVSGSLPPGDPVAAGLAPDAPVGTLGIELHTRRRNRMNGRIAKLDPQGFEIAVDQSFGNCPQYIQGRQFVAAGAEVAASRGAPTRTPGLTPSAARIIGLADTFFIASAHPRQGENNPVGGVDVSHRGGKPGFVKVDGTVLTVPDFMGNFLFNTLGNLMLEPRAGLVFPDFETGDLWHLAVEAEVVWDGPEVDAFVGAERLLRLTVRETVHVPASLTIRAVGPVAMSPFLDRTSSWEAIDQPVWSPRDFRRFKIARIDQETVNVRSFHLEPVDGLALPAHKAGQYLPIRLDVDGKALLRTYTISDAPGGASYRLSVKRQGVGSDRLHAAMVGDIIEALPPRGDFVFDETSTRPAVFLSAGIGVTPMVAMLNSLLVNNGRSRHPNKVWFFHGARNGLEHAFGAHTQAKAERHSNLTVVRAYSAPRTEDKLGLDYDTVGFIDLDLIKKTLPFDDYDFYLCGPPGFMAGIGEGLRALGVRGERIRSEAFGPAAIKAARPLGEPPGKAIAEPGPEAVTVTFQASGKTVFWRPGDGTLLELAENEGLSLPFSCRAGICGACRSGLTAGRVEYAEEPVAEHGVDEVLLCCATPAPGDSEGPAQPVIIDI